VITIKDIAREAACSIRTVSRVLNNASNVNEETRSRVLAVTRLRNYMPDPYAQSLKTKRKRTIGVIVNSVTSDVNRQRIETIARLFNTAGYAILINYADNLAVEEEIVRRFAVRTDALIIFTNLQSPRSSVLDDFAERDFPFILVDPPVRGPYPAVAIDRVSGYREAVRHLASRGRARIALVIEEFRSLDRLRGYRDGLSESGIGYDPALVLRTGKGFPGGWEAAEAVLGLRRTHSIDAVLCHNDKIATGILSFLMNRGARIPEEIALVGFDNDDYSAYLCPPLTTIAQGGSEVGVHIFEQLFNRLELGSAIASRTFDTTLVPRRSA
jgi:LacI family transcriptional regulator